MDFGIINFAIAVLSAIVVIAVSFGIMHTHKGGKVDEAFSDLIQDSRKSELDDTVEEDNSMVARWSRFWDREALAAGVQTSEGALGRSVFFGMIVAVMVGVLVVPDGGPVIGLAGAVAVPFMVRAYFGSLRKKREKRLVDQIPYFIGQMRSNIQSNATPQKAILSVVEDIPAPLGTELELLKNDIEVGMSLDLALNRLSERVPARDLRFLAACIKIANHSGTDLEPQLVTISDTVEERRSISNKLTSAVASVSTAVWLAIVAIPLFFASSFLTNDDAGGFWFSAEGIPYLMVIFGLYLASIFAIRFIINQVSKL